MNHLLTKVLPVMLALAHVSAMADRAEAVPVEEALAQIGVALTGPVGVVITLGLLPTITASKADVIGQDPLKKWDVNLLDGSTDASIPKIVGIGGSTAETTAVADWGIFRPVAQTKVTVDEAGEGWAFAKGGWRVSYTSAPVTEVSGPLLSETLFLDLNRVDANQNKLGPTLFLTQGAELWIEVNNNEYLEDAGQMQVSKSLGSVTGEIAECLTCPAGTDLVPISPLATYFFLHAFFDGPLFKVESTNNLVTRGLWLFDDARQGWMYDSTIPFPLIPLAAFPNGSPLSLEVLVTSVAEPPTILLVGIGALLLVVALRDKQRRE